MKVSMLTSKDSIDSFQLFLQSSGQSLPCQCRIVGDFPCLASQLAPQLPQSRDSSPVPSLKFLSPKLSRNSLWEELCSIDRKVKVLSSIQEGSHSDEVEASIEEDSSETWEDCDTESSGGSGSGGEGEPAARHPGL